MKKRKLKPIVKVSALTTLIVVSLLSVILVAANSTKNVSKMSDDYTYVNDYIFDNYYPVVNQDEKLVRPYNSDKVSIYKGFYDKDASEEEQQNAIIYHEGIYMQNSGVDYKSDEEFDIISSLSGTVTNISDDTLLGKTIELRNSTEVIVMYECLGDILIKKGDTISQGQIIAKSGTCPLNSDIKQSLHFEMYKNGSIINPEKNFDKSIKEITN